MVRLLTGGKWDTQDTDRLIGLNLYISPFDSYQTLFLVIPSAALTVQMKPKLNDWTFTTTLLADVGASPKLRRIQKPNKGL